MPNETTPEENAIDVNELEAIKDESFIEEMESEAGPTLDDGPTITTAQQLEPLIGMSFKILAPNWKVQPAEVELLAESYGEAIDYYYPDAVDSLPPWLTPLIVTAAIVGPRINTPRVLVEKEVKGETVNDGTNKS